MLSNLKLTLNISRIVNGGTEEVVFSQVVARESEGYSPVLIGSWSNNSIYTVPISFRDLTAPTGVPIEYKLGYTFDASSPQNPGGGKVLQYYVGSQVVNNYPPAGFEPMPLLIQERIDTAIAPTFEGGAAAAAS
jgi:hypothetical protein